MPHHQRAGGGRLAGKIHDIRRLAGLLEYAHNPYRLRRNGLLRLFGGRADVVSAVNRRRLCDLAGERARPTGGLFGEDIQTGAKALFPNRGLQSFLVDDFSASRVDEAGALLHRRKKAGVAQPARFRPQSKMHAHDIGRRGDCAGRISPLNAQRFRSFPR